MVKTGFDYEEKPTLAITREYFIESILDGMIDFSRKRMEPMTDLTSSPKWNELNEYLKINSPTIVLKNGEFKGLNASGIHLPGLDATGAILDDSNFSGAYLGGANFSDANLPDSSFEKAILNGANFSRANLVQSIFRKAKLHQAKMESTKFTSANMVGAELNVALFTGADLESVNFSYADVFGTDFSHANLRGAKMSSTRNFSSISAMGKTNFEGIKRKDFYQIPVGNGSVIFLLSPPTDEKTLEERVTVQTETFRVGLSRRGLFPSFEDMLVSEFGSDQIREEYMRAVDSALEYFRKNN